MVLGFVLYETMDIVFHVGKFTVNGVVGLYNWYYDINHYVPIEAPKGELGFYLVSDGGISPFRCHVRAPSLINLTLLRDMVIGYKIADLFVTFGSIDVNMGEVDR